MTLLHRNLDPSLWRGCWEQVMDVVEWQLWEKYYICQKH